MHKIIRKIIKIVKNKKGSILIEALTGMTIFAITATSFSLMLVQANILFSKASVISNEWERIYIKMENKDFSTNVVAGTQSFNVLLVMEDMKKSDIVLANGEPYGEKNQIINMSNLSTTLVSNQIFKKYTEPVKKLANTNEEVHVYAIVDK